MKKSPSKDGMNCNFNKAQVDLSLVYDEVVCNSIISYRSTFSASWHPAEPTPITNAPLSWQLSSYLMVDSGLSTGSASTCYVMLKLETALSSLELYILLVCTKEVNYVNSTPIFS